MNIYFVAWYTGDIGWAILKELEARKLPVFWISWRWESKKIQKFLLDKFDYLKDYNIEKIYFINAIWCGIYWKFLELKEEDFQKSWECNFLVPVRLIQFFAKLSMDFFPSKNISKIIVNINSQAALKPFWEWAAYNSTKAAIAMTLKIFEKEYRQYWFKVIQLYPPVILNTKMTNKMWYMPKKDKLMELDFFIKDFIRKIIN